MEIVISLIILFVGIAILVVIHVCVVGRAFRGDNNNDIDDNHDHGVDNIDEVMKNLPCFEYEEPKEKGCCPQVDCAVCLESFEVGDLCRLLPNCGHSFHVQCIDSWILQTPVCPICRTWVLSPTLVSSAFREPSAVSENVEIVMT